MELLLAQQDVNPGKPDNRGRTPLSLAAGGGHAGVVKMLLPDKPDNRGQTPLSMATESRHTRVVALPQSRKAVTPGMTYIKPRRHGLGEITATPSIFWLLLTIITLGYHPL